MECGILKAYVVPHPPIILPEIGKGEEKEIEATTKAFKQVADEIAELAPSTIILSSPHAPLYRDAFFLSFSELDWGDMGTFGVPFVKEILSNDLTLGKAILKKAGEMNLPIFADTKTNKLDHGSLVPLRFICKKYKDFKFLRFGLSDLPAKTHYRLGQIIAEAAKELKRRVVFIASGDLSHVLKEDGPYGFKKEGPEFDQKLVDILSRAAFDELLTMPKDLTEEAAQCGLSSFQIMAGLFDGKDVETEIFSYEGTFGVGYAVGRFVPTKENSKRRFLELEKSKPATEDENSVSNVEDPYVSLARYTIEDYVKTGIRPELPKDLPAEMLKNRAATFVSLHREGRLRGCIGTLAPCHESVALEIQYNAISAATEDPRFTSLHLDELDDLQISVDVLSEPEKISGPEELDPKKYGVIVSHGYRRGVLLPNLEGVDTVEEQIDIARQKAGIAKYEEYQLERFEVVRHE
ncbi:MAG: AmmeMemoRadiSam system protein A [Ruminococcaceae bacterium]|nr:AmmeMemoRadiSam system protein A [Oscillospiraceae bacterium]